MSAVPLIVLLMCAMAKYFTPVTAGTCTKAWVEYLGMTRQETGSLQIGYATEAACRAKCEELTTCVSYDFDPPAIFPCSVYEDNLVDGLDDHPTINHYQLEVTCVLQDAEQTTCTYKYVGEYTFVDASIAVPAEAVDEDTCLRACTQDANCLSAAVLAGDAMPCTLSGDPLVYESSRTTDPGRKQYEQIQCTRQDTTTAAITTASTTGDRCDIPPGQRVNCGHKGISAESCEDPDYLDGECCFDNRRWKTIWCYHPKETCVDPTLMCAQTSWECVPPLHCPAQGGCQCE